MLTTARKRELLNELTNDLESYIQRQQLIENFIDSTCQTSEEIDFMSDIDWCIRVEGDV